MDSSETLTVGPALPDRSAGERERMDLPGAIQPYGCLLFCALPSWTVKAVSANAGEFLARDPAAMLDEPLDTILPGQTLHDLRNVLQAAMVSGGAEWLLDQPIDGGSDRYDLTVHMAASNVIVEIVPRQGAGVLATDSLTLVKSMVGRLNRAPTLERFLQLAVNQVRAVTGFDRVMIYKFLSDGLGEVKAEALRSGLTPFLGLRYPASGISPDVRERYRKQRSQLIPDVDYEPVPLLARSESTIAADLGLSSLRSVSPVHLADLRNMGCHAAMTISIMVGDALWGLIVCHHSSPRRVSSSTCSAVELFGHIFSLQIEAKEQARDVMLAAERRHAHDRLIGAMSAETSIFETLEPFRDLVTDMIPCDGFGFWSDKGFVGLGVTPPDEAMPDLVRYLGEKDPRAPYATDALARELTSASAYVAEVSGVLSIPFSRDTREYLLFFRQEAVQTVTWGRDPTTAPATIAQDSRDIGARRSVEAWRETVRGRSMPWHAAEFQIADTLRISLLELILRRVDRVNDERRAAQESQAILIAELNHRVKNTLALIRSLVRQSRQNAGTMEGFAEDLDHRIRALALAHDQLMQTGWAKAPLRRLLEAEARAWTHSADRVALSGLGVTLDPRAYQALALVFHELMTNAAKYGALSQKSGRLTVSWVRAPGGDLRIAWRELGGPRVEPPNRRGFGSVIVEQTIPFELRGEARIDYLAQGVHASFIIPALHVGDVAEDEPHSSAPSPDFELKARRLLLVEDSMMIALDAQAMLTDEGLDVEIAGTIGDAERLLAGGDFDVAILDVNLSGETSFGVADRLIALGLPFVFATGYGETIVMPERFRAVPVVSKPYDGAALRLALGEVQAALAADGAP